MSGFNGTPGPWIVAFHGPDNCWVVDSERESAVAKIMRYKNNGVTQKANFDLIAAAPELLEAVQEAMKFSMSEEAYNKCAAAVSKALGQ